MEIPIILSENETKLVVITADNMGEDFHSASDLDGDKLTVILNDKDSKEKQVAGLMYEVANTLCADTQTALMLHAWANMNEYGRDEILGRAWEYVEVPEYAEDKIIPFPFGG